MVASSSYPPHVLGRRGEILAAAHLRSAGWRIVDTNVRFGRREVDIVARKGPTLAFVEVKTRSGEGFGVPQEAITRAKRREIEAVAAHFLASRPQGAVDVRFDAVAVWLERGGQGARIQHIEDAWRPGWP